MLGFNPTCLGDRVLMLKLKGLSKQQVIDELSRENYYQDKELIIQEVNRIFNNPKWDKFVQNNLDMV